MSWLAISGESHRWVCPDRFGQSAAPQEDPLAEGCLMLETRLSGEGRPQTLLQYERKAPWPGSISIRAVPDGGIVLVLEQGKDRFHTTLQPPPDTRTDVLRITFSWDSRARHGRITLERPEGDHPVAQDTPPPPPLLAEDLYSIVHRPARREIGRDVVFFAASDHQQPVGPMPALSARVPVATPFGDRPVAQLICGDTVCTRDHGVVPVLHRVSRTVPALGSFRPIRLRAPYFGLTQDVVVAPHQRLVITGTDVEYIFGREAVLVPAQSLVNGFAAHHVDSPLLLTYHQLLLPRHEPALIAGAQMESLYIGRLRRDRAALGRSLLADCPSGLLPEHARAGLKVLGPFEANTLAQARAA